MSGPEKIVVIALGNRFRGDDAIGPIVAERLNGRPHGCTIVEGRDDAMAIVSAWEKASLAVIIDASVSGASPGSIRRLEAGAQPLSREWARCSSHGLGLAEAVELGKALERFPGRLVIFAVEAGTLEKGAALSPQVMTAADEVVRKVEAEIASFASSLQTNA